MKAQENAVKSAFDEGRKRKATGTPFPKGVSGNPKGKPKGTVSILSIIKKSLNKQVHLKESKERKAYATIIADNMVKKAARGDFNTQKLLMNYIEGLPTQKIEMDSINTNANVEVKKDNYASVERALLESIRARESGE